MRTTTKNLLARLEALRPGPYRVREEESLDDSEIIYLHDDYFLAIDEDAALPTVSLEEFMPVGGNVLFGCWVVTEDAVLNRIAAASLDV